MKKILLALAIPFALSACATTSPGVEVEPAPVVGIPSGDEALDAAWKSFDVALDAIALLNLKPGTPKARAVASGIRTVNRALGAAERFAAARSLTEYLAALAEAKTGLEEIRTALRGN